MSEWDFLWGLNGQDLEDAMTTGAIRTEWDEIECSEQRERSTEWFKLKMLRDNNEITNEEFKKRKNELF